MCVAIQVDVWVSPNQHTLTVPPPSLLLPSDQALVFGCPLDKLCAREKTTFPKFIAQCIREVEKRGLNSQGIYRLSGNAAEITRLRYLVDQGEVSRKYICWVIPYSRKIVHGLKFVIFTIWPNLQNFTSQMFSPKRDRANF